MLTAKRARELANDFERREQAKKYMIDQILPQIEKHALRGNIELIFEINKPELESFIASELEDLGYSVEKLNSNIFNLRTIYRIQW